MVAPLNGHAFFTTLFVDCLFTILFAFQQRKGRGPGGGRCLRIKYIGGKTPSIRFAISPIVFQSNGVVVDDGVGFVGRGLGDVGEGGDGGGGVGSDR